MAQTASLVFFYFGEGSYVRRLAQETVPLRNALKGYDKQVLLWHQTNFGPFEVSQAADKLADVEDIPTKENLVKYLNELGDEGYVVDIYIFSHGHPGGFLVSKGTYADNGSVSAAYLESKVRPLKLRAVWQCNCWGSTMNETWRKLGAKVTTGSRFINYYPTTFNEFIRRWQGGETFGSAVSKSCDAGARTAPQAFMLVDAASRLKDWAGNIWQAARVLGNNEHAKRYFTRCWDKEFWQEGKSGKQNMNYSSRMLFQGNRKVTKATVW
jgi:hypothetical protein